MYKFTGEVVKNIMHGNYFGKVTCIEADNSADKTVLKPLIVDPEDHLCLYVSCTTPVRPDVKSVQQDMTVMINTAKELVRKRRAVLETTLPEVLVTSI